MFPFPLGAFDSQNSCKCFTIYSIKYHLGGILTKMFMNHWCKLYFYTIDFLSGQQCCSIVLDQVLESAILWLEYLFSVVEVVCANIHKILSLQHLQAFWISRAKQSKRKRIKLLFFVPR